MSFDMPKIARVEVREERCPECYMQCGWCSGNVLMMREVGCTTIFPKKGKCPKGEAVKGTKCSTCDGSTKVQVRREILGAPVTESGEP